LITASGASKQSLDSNLNDSYFSRIIIIVYKKISKTYIALDYGIVFKYYI